MGAWNVRMRLMLLISTCAFCIWENFCRTWQICTEYLSREARFLFCLFSKGMSEGALSPLLIHLLPLVYVTDGDLGPRHPWLTSTPSDSPANLPQKRGKLVFFCMLRTVNLFLCLCVLVWRSEWARVKSKFTQLTLTMLMFGSKARTWPRCQFTSAEACGEEREGRWPTGARTMAFIRPGKGQIRAKMHALTWRKGRN